ncbi:unnamed protein product [uncultured virus]|nr:unnamed protein product [uncultured virus]
MLIEVEAIGELEDALQLPETVPAALL